LRPDGGPGYIARPRAEPCERPGAQPVAGAREPGSTYGS
jgi:hypothetical protein